MLQQNGSVYIVKGPFNVKTANTISKEGLEYLVQPGRHFTVDLSQITKLDSTLIAVMLDWIRNAKKMNKQIKFTGANNSVRSLMAVYGLLGLIRLHE